VLEQGIDTDRRPGPMARQVRRRQRVSKAAILKLARNGLRPIASLAARGQMANRRNRLRAAQQDQVFAPFADRLGELIEQVLRTLPTYWLQDCARGIGADAPGHGARKVIGLAK